MTTKKMLIVFILAVVGFAWGCSKGSDQPGNTPPVNPPANSCDGISAKFAADIAPLIQSRCAVNSGCHGAGSSNGPGALTNYTQCKNASIGIKSAVVSREMPLGSTLTSAQIAEISCWVDNGALNN